MKKILLALLSLLVISVTTVQAETQKVERVEKAIFTSDFIDEEILSLNFIEIDQFSLEGTNSNLPSFDENTLDNVYGVLQFNFFDVYNEEKSKSRYLTWVTKLKDPISKKKLGLHLRFYFTLHQ